MQKSMQVYMKRNPLRVTDAWDHGGVKRRIRCRQLFPHLHVALKFFLMLLQRLDSNGLRGCTD